MKQFLKKFLSLSLLISAVAIQANGGTATFINRSQGRYMIHQDAGMVGQTHDVQNEMQGWWGTAKATVGWQQTFDSKSIGRTLFGSDLVSSGTGSSCGDHDGGHSLIIQGSTVANRNAKAWLADYLYLPTDFSSTVSIKPRIQSFFADLTFFVGLDEWWEGAYFQIHGPIEYTNWHLGFNEQEVAAGVASYPAGYFAPVAIARTSLLANVQSYMAGNAPFGGSSSFTDTAPVTQTVTFQGLQYAKASCGSRTETGFADLRAELGWNFWRNEDYHMGINIQAAAPTGNKYHSEHLFNAVVGNGKHWELGGGLTGHYVFYRSEDSDKHFGFYLDLNVTHMFKASGLRTFDLKNKPNSKYMLAMQFGTNSQNVTSLATAGTAATKQFADVYAPVANITTIDVDASSAAQIDLVTSFNYTYKKFSWDLGYNFYYRSCEEFDCSNECEPCNNNVNLCTSGQANTWALKGDSKMFGFASGTGGTAPLLVAAQAVPLSATDSTATIYGGDNFAVTGVTPTSSTNATVDNATAAFAGGATSVALYNAPTGTTPIFTSIQPVFLQCSDIDKRGTRSMSHTLFTNLQYNFEGEDMTPYLGFGGKVEFGTRSGDDNCGNGNNTTTTTATTATGCCSDESGCISSSASSWSVWIQGGISFS